MATLFRRSNGVYYLVSTVDGRRVWKSTGCRSKAEALQFIGRGKQEARPKSSIALSQFRDEFLSFARSNFSPSTTALYNSAFAKLDELIGNLPLAQYTPQMIERFKSLRLAEVSPVKTSIDFRSLKAAFNTAVRWDLISNNPFSKCKAVRIPPKKRAYISREQFKLLLEAIDREWFRDIVKFAVFTMMRVGEIVNLKWSSVDFDQRLIQIEDSEEFRTKTHKSRIIPMDDLIFEMLNAMKMKSERVFTFPEGRTLSVGYVSQRFKKYCRQVGLSDSIHFHSLRHTGATWLVQANVPIFTIRELLGHSSVAVTQVYSHLEVEHLRAPLKKLAGEDSK